MLNDALQGTRSIKIDPSYENAAFCAGMVNANHSEPRGCFLLNHDPPTTQRDNYNTTDEVLALLQNEELRNVSGCGTRHRCPRLAFRFSLLVQELPVLPVAPYPYQFVTVPDSTLFIALCFKSGNIKDVCDGSTQSQDWVSLIDDLFDNANAAVADLDLNVQFVLDGACSATLCTSFAPLITVPSCGA